MAIPVYLWLEDDGGAPIKGSVDVNGREGSIEVSELMQLRRTAYRSPNGQGYSKTLT